MTRGGMTKGQLIGKLIKHIVPPHSHLCQVTSSLDLNEELVTYLTQQTEKLYAIQCDVADCYNQLDSKFVKKHAWRRVKIFAVQEGTQVTHKCITFEATKPITFTPTNDRKPHVPNKSITLTLEG